MGIRPLDLSVEIAGCWRMLKRYDGRLVPVYLPLFLKSLLKSFFHILSALCPTSGASSTMTSCSSSRSSMFRSSARYSCSSVTSIQTEASSSPPDHLFMPFLSQKVTALFGGREGDSESFMSERETFAGCQGDRTSHTGGYPGDWSHGDKHGAIWVDDRYYMSVDVNRFEPHDIVVMAFNNNVVIHAEKVKHDGCVIDKFTHKSLLPEDMDPLSVSGTLTLEGVLVISVKSMSRAPSHP
ncbi:uncharacterized protein LOC132900285 [Neoarius graeffei]|uniref:uncharacterized protein LOC132900285 n=1 Tax=Neoarius graeffei TaxID=443677 RepID=UPI00298D5665|nr:uncharacterized protein LOC132900285 [Neoarius graeffei]